MKIDPARGVADSFRRLVRRGIPVVTPVLRDLYRTKIVVTHGLAPLWRSLAWYTSSKEYTNLTYDISENSKKYLAEFLANSFHVTREEVWAYMRELERDDALAGYFMAQVSKTADRYFAALPIKYGRRIGWYAAVRITKPRLVVEAGIDRGIGSCVLAAALLRNAEEGHGGKVVGLDINPSAGRYIAAPYDKVVEVVYGDSLEFLRTSDRQIDFFVHDSRHSSEHESAEFELVWPRLSGPGVVMSDNSHVTDSLYEFARKNSLCFWYWSEEVVNHIASPAGIGLALDPARTTHAHPPGP